MKGMATMLKPDPYFGKKSFRMNKELKTRAGISTVTKGRTKSLNELTVSDSQIEKQINCLFALIYHAN